MPGAPYAKDPLQYTDPLCSKRLMLKPIMSQKQDLNLVYLEEYLEVPNYLFLVFLHHPSHTAMVEGRLCRPKIIIKIGFFVFIALHNAFIFSIIVLVLVLRLKPPSPDVNINLSLGYILPFPTTCHKISLKSQITQYLPELGWTLSTTAHSSRNLKPERSSIVPAKNLTPTILWHVSYTVNSRSTIQMRCKFTFVAKIDLIILSVWEIDKK